MSENAGLNKLRDLVLQYCDEYAKLRQDNQSLSNLDFNNDYGIDLKVPLDWESYKVILAVVTKFPSALVVYHGADDYEMINEMLEGKECGFISWHEIYYALYNKSRDMRPVQHINSQLNSAHVVVVASSGMVDAEVLSHIRSFATGCLICLD